MDDIVIYHNPNCGTSRNVLGMIRDSGQEPRVVEYLKTPLNYQELKDLVARLGVPVRDIMRRKGTPYEELGLDDAKWGEDELLQQMVSHPILLNRPVVVTPKAAKLCRPAETVLELL